MEHVVLTLLTGWVVFMVFCCGTSAAIKCWECKSNADPRCADPFDNTSLPITDCSAKKLQHFPGLKAEMCRKIRQKVYGQWRFIRQCAFLGIPGEGTWDENYCLMRTGTYDVFVETCTCKSKDGCNSAPPTGHLNFFLIFTTLLAIALSIGTLR